MFEIRINDTQVGTDQPYFGYLLLRAVEYLGVEKLSI
jgi:hypothetical protein